MLLRLVVPCALALLLGLYLGARDERAAAHDRLSAVVSSIAGRPVSVHCPGTLERLTEVSPHDGSVAFSADGRPADYADLSGATCSYLEQFEGRARRHELDCLGGGVRCSRDIEQTAVAVNVLTHEAYHLAGHRSEDAVQCYAMQRNAEAARMLGATVEQARDLARFVYEHIYPALPQDYRTSECHDGGPYDLRPASPVWP